MHCTFSVSLYHKLAFKLPVCHIHEIVESVVDAEIAFVRATLPTPIKGMNTELMLTYVRFIADQCWSSLVSLRSMMTRTHFSPGWREFLSKAKPIFECHVSEYAKARVGADPLQHHLFDTEADFGADVCVCK